MKIGELARAAEVSIDTVRFYERRAVLKPAPRTSSGYRSYTTASLERLRLVRELQQLGFTLDDIVELLASVERGGANCKSEKRRFESVLARVDARIAELSAVRRRLVRTLGRCSAGKCLLVERGQHGQ